MARGVCLVIAAAVMGRLVRAVAARIGPRAEAAVASGGLSLLVKDRNDEPPWGET